MNAVEQALLIKIRLANTELGFAEESPGLRLLAEHVRLAISGLGEFDGDEWGGGFCTFYLYGPSADRLFEAVFSVLRRYAPKSGSHVVRRYGPKGAIELVTDLPLPDFPSVPHGE